MKNKSATLVLMAAMVTLVMAASAQSGTNIRASQVDASNGSPLSYPIVDTGQSVCYNDVTEIACPEMGEAFYGQDAQVQGNQPNYIDNGDGTVTDHITGLMWQQDPGDKMTFDEAVAGADAFSLAGYDDWRLPTIKELYSLILFSGVDPSGYQGTDTSGMIPFVDTAYFDFEYGDTSAGERIIDAQFVSSTEYVDTTMNGAHTGFGVNLADGRIKGYPTDAMPGQSTGKLFYVLYVRGSADYGINDLVDNGDGTITDRATGLMWAQDDSGVGMDWEEALAWVQAMNSESYLGYSDWRLPDAKALQSIVDYSRSPATTNSAAIDPLFNATSITNEAGQADYPAYWSSTTHANWTPMPGKAAVYVTFGRAMGYMNGQWIDVHGAGAQRSDPKSGDAADYPTGHGPQGDAIRIDNYVRLVRDAEVEAEPTATATEEIMPTETATPTATDTPPPTMTQTPATATPTSPSGPTRGNIASVAPSEARQGQRGVWVTITLGQEGAPPDRVRPQVVRIGDAVGRDVARSGLEVRARFDFEPGQATGWQDVSVTFPAPNGTITFAKENGFHIHGGEAPSPPSSVHLPLLIGKSGTGAGSEPGYNLFAPLGETTTYLVDQAGKTVYTWPSAYKPGNAVYLLADGTLWRTGNTGSDHLSSGGVGGIVEAIKPDGTVSWSFRYDSAEARLHHDIEVLPNGNVLMIAWELVTASEAIAAGRNPALLKDGELWPDLIIEVNPATDEIVWQWHVWDHLIQDRDPSKANYGVVADHPELIDINYTSPGTVPGKSDWTHTNAVDYNAELDQILLSVRGFSEIWIIDHHTTTAEAAGHAGGDMGMGGDLLYRWGNPQAYDHGDGDDQQLYVQHDAQWIADGLPGAGHILIFNNGTARPEGDYSSIDEIVPPIDNTGNYMDAGPEAPAWTYVAPTPTDFYAHHISGAQRLANGNTLICDGPASRFFEVTTEGELIWEYAYGDQPIFRVTRYPLDYAGLPPLGE